jgi:hypothetical protein
VRQPVAVALVATLALAGASASVVGQGADATPTPTPFGDDDFGPGFEVFVWLVVGLLLLAVSGGALLLAEAASPDDL